MSKALTPSEHQEQCAVFEWKERNIMKHPELRYLFGTLNGVRLTIGQAKKAKRAGNVKGVPDIWLPIKLGGATGLVVELKIKGNYATPEQKAWLNELANNGWMTRVAYGAEEAIKIIEGYLAGKDFQDVADSSPDAHHTKTTSRTTRSTTKSATAKLRKDKPQCTNCNWTGTTVCDQCEYGEEE